MNNWKDITSEAQVDEIVERSKNYPQIIFKDSVSCGISAYAKSRLVDGNQLMLDKADFNYLDLLANSNVSNYIAQKLKVIHQSPQIIVLKDGEVIHMVSHHAIHPDKIAAVI